jgi:hypothetical protein
MEIHNFISCPNCSSIERDKLILQCNACKKKYCTGCQPKMCACGKELAYLKYTYVGSIAGLGNRA